MRSLLLFFLLAWSAQASCIPPPNTYDYEAEAWRAAVLAGGDTLSGLSYRTGTYFMQQVRWWGVRPRIGRASLYLGPSTNAIQKCIIHDWFSTADGTDDLIQFAAADYSESTGLTGNTTTKYLRPNGANGINISTFTVHTNIHMAVYCRTASNQASDEMGVAYAGTGNYGIAAGNGGNTYIFMGLNTPSSANTNAGFVLSTRTATTNAVTYKDAVAIVTDTTSDTGTIGAGIPVVHAFNSAGTVNAFSSRTLSYYGLGFSIPAALVSPYTIAVQNVQQALGRKVP